MTVGAPKSCTLIPKEAPRDLTLKGVRRTDFTEIIQPVVKQIDKY